MARLRSAVVVVVLSVVAVVGFALLAVGSAIWDVGEWAWLVVGVVALVAGLLLVVFTADSFARRHPNWRRCAAAKSRFRGSAVITGFDGTDGMWDRRVTWITAEQGLVQQWEDGIEEIAPWNRVVDVRVAELRVRVGVNETAVVEATVEHESDGTTRAFRMEPDYDAPVLASWVGLASPMASPWEFETAAQDRCAAASADPDDTVVTS